MHREVYLHACLLFSHSFDYVLVACLVNVPVKLGLELEDNIGDLLIHVGVEVIGSRTGRRCHMASARSIHSLELSIELKYISGWCVRIVVLGA